MLDRLAAFLAARRPRGDGGYSTEAVIVIALLAILAIGALSVISEAVMDKAESITLE
ncbi:hypothetical protein [Salinactinospora qingdaonensis]|uniref:Flp family type IVb pilin n=1 Tax=Salinactinospora qingdaonensis TaxID=702744 RepID=A0ABP7FQG3_9ACTN